jgi:hypothetical protein
MLDSASRMNPSAARNSCLASPWPFGKYVNLARRKRLNVEGQILAPPLFEKEVFFNPLPRRYGVHRG